MIRRKEYIGPVDQYGRPINTTDSSNHTTEDRKIGIIFFTILGIVTIIVLAFVFTSNYLNQTRLEIPKATLSTTNWTRDSVIVTIDISRGNIVKFSFDGGSTWQESNQFEVDRNQELLIQVQDSKGRVSKKVVVTVSNIDRDAPELYFIDSLYVPMGSEFDPKANVTILDYGSGIQDYEVDTSTLDVHTIGEYFISYYVTDQVGNKIQRKRKIIVDTPGKTYQYRFRAVKMVDTKCEISCRCVNLEGSTCPAGTELSEDNRECCSICEEPCQQPQYGNWSEWSTNRIIPSSELEVEMRSETSIGF